jgi:hypothetical protein
MSRGNGRDIDRQVALFPSFSTLIRVVLRVPSWLVVQSCFSIFLPELRCHGSLDFRSSPQSKSDPCVTEDIHLLSARFLKRAMTYLLSHHPDAPVSTTSPLPSGPSPNCSDSHFNSTKSSLSPFCDNCAVTSFVRRQKTIWRYISANYSD